MLQIALWKRLCIWGLVALGLILALPNAFYTRVETRNDAVAAIEAGADPAALQDEISLWPGWMPSGLVNLGLDLRGGAHLLAEVQVADVYQARVEGMWPEVRDLLREERDRVGPIRLQPTDAPELRVRLVERPEMSSEAASLVRGLARPTFDALTGIGGSDIEVTTEGADIIVRLSEAEQRATDDRTVQQALGVQAAGELVEHALAHIAKGLVQGGVRRLVVAGGETSGAVVQALGVQQLRIGAAICPGVPWTQAALPDSGEAVQLALKSGNFGGVDFFAQALQQAGVAL